jgi:uncharacterized Ntn-hydrolase superfamily protein
VNRVKMLGVLAIVLGGCAAAPDGSFHGVSGTFSIVAIDPDEGVCGAAVASRYPAVGKVVPYVRAGAGAFCTQHWHNPKWGEPALDALAAGKDPEQVLADLLRDDPNKDKRQLLLIDMDGRAVVRNPARPDLPGGIYWGAASGRHFACAGNTLAGREVVEAMVRGFERTKGSLADRLMAALGEGDRAGGDHRGRLAAGLRVAKKGVDGLWLDLQVEKSADAVRDLEMKYAALDHPAKGVHAEPPLPPDLPLFWKSRLSDVGRAVAEVRKGTASVLVRSPGGRDVHLVAYGEKDARRGAANYNSAAGGADPHSYAAKDGTQKPVVLFLGPVHGQEVEGVAGLVNLLSIAESGRDLRGRDWKDLSDNIAKCRVLIVPCGNPDGRARCAQDAWVGADPAVHERVGMGVKPDGSNHSWPGVKRIHPMRGAGVKELGAYWNDDAVNLMHDEWFDPMAPETRAFFRLAREEAPDLIVSLHSHGSAPAVLPTAYVPRAMKEALKELGDRVQKRYREAGLPHRAGGPAVADDGAGFPPPSFNLASALHHACGAVSFVHETCTSVKHERLPQATHDQLLDIQLLLYDEMLKFAVERPVDWKR